MKFIGLTLVSFLFLNACEAQKSEYAKISGFAQGTNYHITYENSKNEDYRSAIDSILKAFDKSCSMYDSTSIISRINNNDPMVEADDWFINVFKKSAEVSALSDGVPGGLALSRLPNTTKPTSTVCCNLLVWIKSDLKAGKSSKNIREYQLM